MTVFHWAQVGLALLAAGIVVERSRALLFVGRLDTQPFLTAFGQLLLDGPSDAAHALAQEALPAWAARVALSELEEREGRAGPGAVAELVLDLRREAVRGIRAVRTIGRAASPLAFVGVMVEIGLAFRGDHGLLALQQGLVEQRALQRAVVGMTIGLTTSLCCFVAATTLHRAARDRIRDIGQVNELFEVETKA